MDSSLPAIVQGADRTKFSINLLPARLETFAMAMPSLLWTKTNQTIQWYQNYFKTVRDISTNQIPIAGRAAQQPEQKRFCR